MLYMRFTCSFFLGFLVKFLSTRIFIGTFDFRHSFFGRAIEENTLVMKMQRKRKKKVVGNATVSTFKSH